MALEVERVLAEEAKERQIENGKNNASNLAQLQESRNAEKSPQSGVTEPEEKSRDKAASLIGNTNARYVQDAKTIEREAPEVKELVMSGKVNMGDAVKLSKLAPEKRKGVISKIEANPEGEISDAPSTNPNRSP